MKRNYLIITTIRNEASQFGHTIDSVVRQTLCPIRWLIVDDGSTDNTSQIITQLSAQHSWIEVIIRKDRGYRQSGVGVVTAFYDGFSRVSFLPWNYLVKLDGDVRIPANYFESLIEEFEHDSTLGICSGEVYNEEDGKLSLDSPEDPSFHVRGAAKIYRRTCWEAIGGILKVNGFDCIDNVKARMLGWNTRRFPQPEVIHLRRTGQANGAWRNSFKDGIGANAIGYHPLFMFFKCIRRLLAGRSIIGVAGQLCGFIRGYYGDIPRVNDPALVRYLRRQQMNRLLGKDTIWR